MASVADLPGGRIRKDFIRNLHEDVLPLGTLLAIFSTSGYFLKYADKEVIMGIIRCEHCIRLMELQGCCFASCLRGQIHQLLNILNL